MSYPPVNFEEPSFRPGIIGRMRERGRSLLRALKRFAAEAGGWHRIPLSALRRGGRLLRSRGIAGLFRRLRLELYRHAQADDLPFRTQLTPTQAEQVHSLLDSPPRFSIVIDVSKTDWASLEGCLDSIAGQYYADWEVILLNDGSSPANFAEWASRDSRIRRLEWDDQAANAAKWNAALASASGRCIGFLPGDVQLSPDALTWFAAVQNAQPDAGWLYADESVLDKRGRCRQMRLKPDFSPEFLLSSNYVGPCCFFDAALLRAMGGFRSGMDGGEGYDLALRMADHLRRDQVAHIPRVLCHRQEQDAKASEIAAGRRVVKEALQRRGIAANVNPSSIAPGTYEIRPLPKGTPKISIIIPTKNGLDDLTTCLNSLKARTQYVNYDVIVIDNNSDDPELLKFLADQEAAHTLKVIHYPHPFNHSAMNNLAVGECDAEFIVLMNNDVKILTDGWLEMLLGTVQMEDSIAGAGAKLLYPDGTIQHGGLIWGIGGLAGHAHRFEDDDAPGYLQRACLLNEFSGATAALLMLRIQAFLDVGGFDAEVFPTSFNDVDLWLRLQKQGHRCLFNPFVKAYHYESKTRRTATDLEQEYERRLQTRWQGELQSDPFYNPNLALENELFAGHRPFPLEVPLRRNGAFQTLQFDLPELTGEANPSAFKAA